MRILVVGAGTIGLPFGLVLSQMNHVVDFVDTCSKRIKGLQDKTTYLEEPGLKELLVSSENVTFSAEASQQVVHDVVVFAVNLSTSVESIEALYEQYSFQIKRSGLVLFRSTLNNHQWDKISYSINSSSWAYIPERSRPGDILNELRTLPQIVGSESHEAFSKTHEIFNGLGCSLIETSVIEAIAIKLLTNAWRVSVFELGNSFFLECKERNLDFIKISEIAKKGYPRLESLPSPGFISGPCLPKDFSAWSQWNDKSIKNEFPLNTKLTQAFLAKLLGEFPELQNKRIALWGNGYRVDLKDDRKSFSSILKKILNELGATVECFSTIESDHLSNWKADLVINLFPTKSKQTDENVFNFWSGE